MLIGQSRWSIGSWNVNVKSSVVVDVLSSIVMNVASAEIRIVKSIVFVSQSFAAFERLRRGCEALVDGLRCWNEFVLVLSTGRGRLEARGFRRNLLQNVGLLQQVKVVAAAAFREVEVLVLSELSLRLLAVLRVERSE